MSDKEKQLEKELNASRKRTIRRMIKINDEFEKEVMKIVKAALK